MSAFHAYALRVSKDSGVFYSDSRRDAWEFTASKNTITKWTKRLEKEGWFRRLDMGRRLKRNKRTGMYASIRYEVLDHDTWATCHPGKCRFRESTLSPKVGQAPVPTTESPVPVTDSTGPNSCVSPVPQTGTEQVLSMRGKGEEQQERGVSPLCALASFPSETQIKDNGQTKDETDVCPDCGGIIYPWAIEDGMAHRCLRQHKRGVGSAASP